MDKQLPELLGPNAKNNYTRSNQPPFSLMQRRNPYLGKWTTLFENRNDQWIAFQPQLGRTVYPCYACRSMFGRKNTFVDHINRRAMILKYKCTICKRLLIFYNPCSFLVHARFHFTDNGGSIDLDQVEVSMLPLNLAGVIPLTNIPRLFENVDDAASSSVNLAARFYRPLEQCEGKRIVLMTTNDLVFFCSSNMAADGSVVALTLKQVNRQIPRCEFIPVQMNNNYSLKITNVPGQTTFLPTPAAMIASSISARQNSVLYPIQYPSTVTIIPDLGHSEVIDVETESESESVSTETSTPTSVSEAASVSESASVPEVTISEPDPAPAFFSSLKLKNIKDLLLVEHVSTPTSSEDENGFTSRSIVQKLPKCPECKEVLSVALKDHFLEINRPYNDKYKCSTCELVSPSACSLNAHKRIHEYREPFVCPECGEIFGTWSKLNAHIEDVCYHRAKSIRYKCPAKKCGKIFAQTITFGSHFPVAHIRSALMCERCQSNFSSEAEFEEHRAKNHSELITSCCAVKECTVCLQDVENVTQHVLIHVQNRENRIYVYICKYCRGYYRSKHTYSCHLLRCSKLLLNNQVKREAELREYQNGLKCKIVKYCKECNGKEQFLCAYKNIKNLQNVCAECGKTFSSGIMYKLRLIRNLEYTDNIYIRRDPDTLNLLCVLCEKVMKKEEEGGKHKCKYSCPVVRVVKLLGNVSARSVPDTISSLDDSSSHDTITSEGPSKRKRKRFSGGNGGKNKRPHMQDTVDKTVQPIVFDGEYKCSACPYRDKSRVAFHAHIHTHRDISTAYQCMECGECFVVKPSLMKHLQAIHLIDDVKSYLANNECYDKDAVRELEENMRLLPGELKETVAEHQCRICRVIFSDAQELSKHFRVHGMAFLMKKIIK